MWNPAIQAAPADKRLREEIANRCGNEHCIVAEIGIGQKE